MSDILVAREPQNSHQPKNSIERFDDIKARNEATKVWTQEREDIAWLCDEVEWLRTAYVVHSRKVVEANPVRSFQDEMLIAKIRAQRNEARDAAKKATAKITLADQLAMAVARLGLVPNDVAITLAAYNQEQRAQS